jgi:hypothetical protein
MLLDQGKKMWVYNKNPDLQLLSTFHQEVGNLLDEFATLIDVTDHTLEVTNMEKLKKRYPQGYTDQAAQARADKGGKE